MRPKRDKAALEAVLEHYRIPRAYATLVFVRGHYLDTMGVTGENDKNIYDDSCFLISPNVIESWNANTDPSFVVKNGKPLAVLNPGHYIFYPSFHKISTPRRYKALRTYPEGASLNCTRNGVPSTCSAINIHRGGVRVQSLDRVHSEGCLTIPETQYADWQTRVWRELELCEQPTGSKTINGKESKLIPVVLIENKLVKGRQMWVDHTGRII